MDDKSSNSQKDYDNKFSNEKVKKFLQEFYEVEDLYQSEKMDYISNEYKDQTMIEKYNCEDKYSEVVRCLDKVAYPNLSRCEFTLEELGRCVFDRMNKEKQNEKSKKSFI